MDNKTSNYLQPKIPATPKWPKFNQVLKLLLVRPFINKKNLIASLSIVFYSLLMILALDGSRTAYAMTRTLKKEAAIVIAAFGTTTKAKATYDFLEEQLHKELPAQYQNHKIAWAFTSEIVRERANKKFAETGAETRYLSLLQTLANLEDEGYRKIAIQPLHIFPGQEFKDLENVIGAFRQMGLQIEYGGPLLHKWDWVFESVEHLENSFLRPEEGCNILVVHGTPLTFPGSNSTYLGLDRYLNRNYTNVFVGGVDGVLTREQALSQAKAYKVKKVRFIPFMYVAGDHIMNDIMSSKEDDKDGPSWALELERAEIKVEAVQTLYKDNNFFKGLGFYEEINKMFISQLLDSLGKLER